MRLDLAERLALFGFTEEDLQVARKMWTIMEPDAAEICAIQLEQWHWALGDGQMFEAQNEERALSSRIDDLQKRHMHLDELDWVQSAERVVGVAFGADVSLSRILAMDSAAGAKMLEVLPGHLELITEWFTGLLEPERLELLLEDLRTVRDAVRPDATSGT